MDNKLKTDFMSMAAKDVKTSVMPGMSENVKTGIMPGVSEDIKTDVMPKMSKDVKTSVLPKMGDNGKTDFMHGAAQDNTKKFYRDNDNNKSSKEKIIVNDRQDKHYRTIGEYFNEGGEAELYHVECIETNERYVAKVYCFGKKYNTHIDRFYDDVKP